MSDDANGTPAPRWPLPGLALGCDYNPEQWPESVWAEDMRLMKQAGVGFATVGVFPGRGCNPGRTGTASTGWRRYLTSWPPTASLLGLGSEEFFPLAPGEVVQLDNPDRLDRGGGTGSLWTEFSPVTDAEVVATYLNGPVAGRPAITRNSVGTGTAWYVGTWLDDDALLSLLDRARREAGVVPPVKAPEGVEMVRRRGEASSYLFVLNHTVSAVTISANGYDLVSESQVIGSLTVQPGESAVVREVD